MVGRTKKRATTWYPRPHESKYAIAISADNTASARNTIIPLAFYDEGQGAPANYSAHPENASFTSVDKPNCYPDSRIDSVNAMLEVSLSQEALETDKIHALKFGYMTIFTAFENVLTASDELTAETIKSILELQSEATDRQTYPLWTGTKMSEKISGEFTYDADVPGLTTTQVAESVDWNNDMFYDALQYYTISDLLKTVCGGLKWVTLTRSHPTIKIPIHIRNNVKRMNPYTFFGLLLTVPKEGTFYQFPKNGTLSAIDHVFANVTCRYLEWNEGFDFDKV
jgi:hypothetical protein